MILDSKVILHNLNILETLIEKCPLIAEYVELVKSGGNTKREDYLCKKIKSYSLYDLVEFISFKNEMDKNGQKLFYEEKIDYDYMKDILIKTSKSKTTSNVLMKKKSSNFSDIVNSKISWKTHSKTLDFNAAIITNYFIQNKVSIHYQYRNRINQFYIDLISIDDCVLEKLIDNTEKVSDHIFDTIKNIGVDVRKVDTNALLESLRIKIDNIINTTIKPGVDVICTKEHQLLTINKSYKVIRSSYYGRTLKVYVECDSGSNVYINFNYFDTIDMIRKNAISDLLS